MKTELLVICVCVCVCTVNELFSSGMPILLEHPQGNVLSKISSAISKE